MNMDKPLRRILVVDDTPEDRELYRRFLRTDPDHQYELIETESGADGISLSRTDGPDCILLDYRLPDVDGLSFLNALDGGSDGIAAPVIVLTGHGSESVAVEAMKNGAQDYLLKSTITPSGLVRAVENAIEKVTLVRRMRRQTQELADKNGELEREVAQRKRAEQALQRTYDELEQLVTARTAELSRANEELSLEVAERRRIEEERAQLLVREQQANRLKDEFLATVSHELRTPLNAVLGWARVLRATNMDGDLRERALESIERNAQSQARLIEDILEDSRIVTGKLRLKVKAIDLAHVLDAALDVVRPAAEARDIVLETDIPRRPWRSVGDPDRLQQVIWNLLSNAVKFTPAGGIVTIRATRTDGTDELVVSDTGIGIEPAFLPSVFDTFRQADASSTRTHGGLGLGLSIVQRMARVLNHGLALDSNRGGGSHFSVTVPTTEIVTHAGTIANVMSASRTPMQGALIVVVENEPAILDGMRTLVTGWGADVIAEADPASAMQAIERDGRRPTGFVVDYHLDRGHGIAAIADLREKYGHDLPAILITADRSPKVREAARAAEISLLNKPVKPASLRAIIGQWCKQRLLAAE
jgi:signal transduction histidine kinase